MGNKIGRLIEKLWDTFCSMKMGLALLGVIALAAGIGTIIPQQFTDPESVQAVANIWRTLGFTNVYYSTWFRLLLGLLCINLVTCNVQGFRRIYNLTFKPEPPKESANIPRKINAAISGSNGEELKQKTQKILKKKKFRVTQLENEGKWGFIAQKHVIGNWGSFTTHISFVILILGALIGSLSGFKGYMVAYDGSDIPIQEIKISKGQINESFIVKINSVEDRILPNGERDNWYTDLSIIESDKEVMRGTLSVNHPLTYKGISFYQSGYAPGALFTINTNGKKYQAALQNKGGDYFNIPGTNLHLTLVAIQRGVQGPVIFYQVFEDLYQVQDGQLAIGQSEDVQGIHAVTFDRLIGFTGLQVKADPGVGVVWLGCGLLMMGLLLSFYWQPVRIAGILDLHPAPILTIGLYSGKFDARIQKEFDRLVDEIKS